ncbi:hypothetical protein ACFQGT_16950 [Natrialbaceae archaeon GCM10025810]|uniref:hypothetical protein n=1 Tax=Halovalidus salilacus TaxID=3075124 RepID=UPI003616DC16
MTDTRDSTDDTRDSASGAGANAARDADPESDSDAAGGSSDAAGSDVAPDARSSAAGGTDRDLETVPEPDPTEPTSDTGSVWRRKRVQCDCCDTSVPAATYREHLLKECPGVD